MQRIITGSRAFFSGIEGFTPKDIDEIIITPMPCGFEFIRQTTKGSSCLFEVTDRPVEEHIAHALEKAPAMTLVRFLTPEYAQATGLTIDELQSLQPLAERLDPKHQYARVIFEAYILNGSFTLTDEQRRQAYEAYRAARQQTEVKHRRMPSTEL